MTPVVKANGKANWAVFVWVLTVLIYLLFMAALSALYPYGVDEYLGWSGSLKQAFEIFWATHNSIQPRIGSLFSMVILYLGKWSFVLLNPIVQISLAFACFYFIFLRKPDFKTFKDYRAFLLLCLFSILAVPSPSETVFWIGGATNYSWTMLAFMIVLCELRMASSGKFSASTPAKLFLFAILGLFLGMSNENNAPLALIIFILTFVYFRVKNIKISAWYYLTLAGIIAGLIILFGNGATANRAALLHYEGFFQYRFSTKIFLHIGRVHDYISGVFLPFLAPLLIIFAFFGNLKKAVKSEDFVMSVLCWLCSFVLAAVLFLAPPTGSLRFFYSSAVFSILAFIFIIKFMRETYGVNLFRYLYAGLLIVFIVISPLFVFPYVDLHIKSTQRIKMLKNAQTDTIVAEPLVVIAGPSYNLTITHYDGMYNSKFASVNGIKAKLRGHVSVNELGRYMVCKVI
jgi:hypothetical protein